MVEPNPSGSPPGKKLAEQEQVKAASRYPAGHDSSQSLANPLTGSVTESDAQLLKFHGTYQQDDRDLRDERARQRLEPAFEFMVRIRVPGGVVATRQWLALDDLAGRYANGTLRLTTRQAFQLHGVPKWKLRQTIAEINAMGLSTLAACGDVNRNVMCCPNPVDPQVHGAVIEWCRRLVEQLAPRTRAYEEIWLAAAPDGADGADEEPLYGPTYLPRKFKIAIAVPPSNDVDVLAHDLGLIAIVEGGTLAGFDVAVGGGMGTTHGEPATYPNLGRVIGFCRPEQVLDVAEQVVAVQRDFGDRANRKHARLKYTIADRGLDWFQAELERRLGWPLQPARPFQFDDRGDRYGWVRGDRRQLAPDAADRKRPHPRPRRPSAAQRPAGDRGGARRRFPPHGQPEPDRGRRRGRGPHTRSTSSSPPTSSATAAASRACGATPWPAWPCRPAGWPWPSRNATCPRCWKKSRPWPPRPDWPTRTSSCA